MRLLVFGGSFDPVHRGHEAMADAAWHAVQPDRFLWVPSGHAPHKPDRAPAPAEDRAAFLAAILINRPREELCRLELDRPAPSYTVDTLEILRTKQPDAELHFLLGSDSLAHLAGWRDPQRLFELAQFWFAPRRGWPEEALAAFRSRLQPDLRTRLRAQFLAMPPVDLSSTALREAFARGETPSGLHPAVLAEIRRRRCYGARPA
jgi:nicotinate-nucleotide adenylyltransferase